MAAFLRKAKHRGVCPSLKWLLAAVRAAPRPARARWERAASAVLVAGGSASTAGIAGAAVSQPTELRWHCAGVTASPPVSPPSLFSREFGCSPAEQPTVGGAPPCGRQRAGLPPAPRAAPSRGFPLLVVSTKSRFSCSWQSRFLFRGSRSAPSSPAVPGDGDASGAAWSGQRPAWLLARGEELSHPRPAARTQVAGSSNVPQAHDCPAAPRGGWQDVCDGWGEPPERCGGSGPLGDTSSLAGAARTALLGVQTFP